MARWSWLALLLVGTVPLRAEWRVFRDPHVTLYTQAGDESSRTLLSQLAQLRAFFLEQDVVAARELPPLIVVLFRSEADYQPYRLKHVSDAYYAGSGSQHYVVLPDLNPRLGTMTAHEYAHFALGANRTRLPLWLNEGLAELFATVSIGEHASGLGADAPQHLETLRRRAWLPLGELMAMSETADALQKRDGSELFYAQSWALVGMLAMSDAYGPRFARLRIAFSANESSEDALREVYGVSMAKLTSDLEDWVRQPKRPTLRFAGVPAATVLLDASAVSEGQMQMQLADVFAAAGELDRAEAMYQAALNAASDTADAWAALGTVSLRRGNNTEARQRWERAIELGTNDADICYRFAALASWAGEKPEIIRPALERAVLLRSDFDDAHFLLAMIEKNGGHYDRAVSQLRAMRAISPERAYSYWSSLADALTELGQREEAVVAARHAAENAGTPDERAHAAALGYIARTDMAVQFERDKDGAARMVTTRIPHGTANWNPFVEAGDDLRHVRGRLREIDCGEITRFRIATPQGLLTLAMPDPSRVEMRNAPPDFACGEQSGGDVIIDFAAKRDAKSAGVIRGMDFAPAQ